MEIKVPWKFKGSEAVRLDGTPIISGCTTKPEGPPPMRIQSEEVQPEAIQKAVEALEQCLENTYIIGGDVTGRNAESEVKATCRKQAEMCDVALEGLRTHQSELEALKAENAALRRAVVDFVKADEVSGDKYRSVSLGRVCDKHSKTIAKAKAVQDV